MSSAFPSEISLTFLDHLDWIEAWKNRAVCRAWRDYIELNLAPLTWLPGVELNFPDEGTHSDPHSYLTFRFQRLEDDGTAIFTDTTLVDNEEAFTERVARYRVSTARPIITMSDFAHDIAVPGLAVDTAAMALRFPWRDLFVRFLSAEDKACQQFSVNLQRESNGIREMMTQLAGMPGEIEVIKRIVLAGGRLHDDAYCATRAQRLGFHDPDGDMALKRFRGILFSRSQGDSDEDEWTTESEDSEDGSDDAL